MYLTVVPLSVFAIHGRAQPCNHGLKDLAEAVKRGVWEKADFPEFLVSSTVRHR